MGAGFVREQTDRAAGGGWKGMSMRGILMLGALFLSFALLACPTSLPVEPPTTVVTTLEPCIAGCENLASNVHCGSPDAGLCTLGCETAVADNDVQWALGYVGPNCWAKATSLAMAEACPGVGEGGCRDPFATVPDAAYDPEAVRR
jgi:hypothetical protein